MKKLPPFYKKQGFSLAGVLITLAIIEVIASITITNIINTTKKLEVRTSLKDAYSFINQAFIRMKTDQNENIYNKYRLQTGQFKSDYIKYFLVNTDHGKTGIVDHASIAEDDPNFRKVYTTFNNSRSIYTQRLDDGQFVTLKGYTLYFENFEKTGVLFITVDVNGHKKLPNSWGRDLFTFQIMPDDSILPMGAPKTAYRDQSVYCSKTSTHPENGIACTYTAFIDDKYWENW